MRAMVRKRIAPLRWAELVLTTIAVAGCTESAGFTDDGRTVIAEDQYYEAGFQATRPVALSISVEVLSGPSIDVLVLDSLNFEQLKAGNAFVHYASCGGIAAQGFSRSCNLDSGSYFVVLDNTDVGQTGPPFNGVDDGADVDWTISAG